MDFDNIKDPYLKILFEINNIVAGARADESEVQHQISYHKETVHLVYQDLAKKMEEVQNLVCPIILELMENPHCKFCNQKITLDTAHYHDGNYVGDCCWNERLRTTE